MSQRPSQDRSWRPVIALAGWWCIAIGIAGLIWHRNWWPLWVVLIGFGIGGLPRLFSDWRNRRQGEP